MTRITKQLGENVKSIHDLKRNNKKLEGEVDKLKREIQDLNRIRQP
jgi:cell division protein FtsB